MIAPALLALAALGSPSVRPSQAQPVVVASKPFGESYLLAEMFAQLLEARGIPATRRPGVGATEVAFAALRAGAIDLYPEYTGTGLIAILHAAPLADPRGVYAVVARTFRERYGVRWLPPLGFENTYAIAVRRETAERLHLATLTDLARAAPMLRAGLTPDFIGRADGLPGLARAYGLHFREVRPLQPALKYQALAGADVDVIDGYSTDGLIARYDLVVLRDDRGFFPPYEAAAVLAPGFAERSPAAVAALTELSGRLDVQTMRRLNRRVEVDREPVARVAAAALTELGLGRSGESRRAAPPGARGGLVAYLWDQRRHLLSLTARHVLLVVVSLGAAIAIALPLGLVLERRQTLAEGVIRAVGGLQTIPGIALLAFMVPLLGIGIMPALVALFLYSIFPILRNTYSGVRDAAPDAVAAGRALGMTPLQVLGRVRLPLASPIILAGIRTAAVVNVGTATLAAFIGAGGLGEPIASGLALADTRMILSGALPAAALALAVDGLLGLCERRVRPGGS